jgi:ribonuclease P protein component
MIERLKKRRDFVRAARGKKAARRSFFLEARERSEAGPPRFGFTVSKRVAKSAVRRNRIRRRLKEAARLVAAQHAADGVDYVLVARPSALTQPFSLLRSTLADALRQIGADRARRPSREGAERAHEE